MLYLLNLSNIGRENEKKLLRLKILQRDLRLLLEKQEYFKQLIKKKY